MNCWRTRQLMAAYLDGELSPAETELIADHVRICPECAELRDRIAAIPALDLPRLDPEAEDEIWSRMDDALEAAWQRHERGEEQGGSGRAALEGLRAWFRGRRLAIPVPVAAIYILLIVGLTGLNLVTFQRMQHLSEALDGSADRIAATPVEVAPVVRASGTMQPARGAVGSPMGHALSASVSLPTLGRAAVEEAHEEPPPLSIPVYDTATGAVIYHAVDQAPAIGY